MDEHECAWCGEQSTLCCNSCSEVWYCSKQHQRLHWNEHYRECKTFKMESSDSTGRYLVASRSMKSGTTIFVDDPLVIGPLGTSDILCLTCHSPIYEEEFYKCADCSWPMCSQKCAASDAHDDECEVLRLDENRCGVPCIQGATPRFDLIMILRCLLLKRKDPENWDLILSMASHAEERKEEQEPHQVAAVRYFTEICKGDWDEDTIHHVRGVIVTNALEIRGPGGMHLRVLYPFIRLFNHSCLPNVHLSADTEGRMEAKAAIDIKRGSELFICYCGTDIPIWERHAYLATVHYFDCACERCSDPSEFGTMFSSSRCPLCPKEIMKPTISCGELIWTCPKCGMENSATEIAQEIEEWIFRLEMNEFFGTGSPHKISHALAVIEQHFHITHYMWLRTAQAALRKMVYDSSFAALKVKKYIWEKILDIYSVFEPGLTRRRGMALLEVGKTAYNMSNSEFLKKGEISVYQVETFLRESKTAMNEAYNILRTEPAGTVEQVLAETLPPKMTAISEELEKLKAEANKTDPVLSC